MRLLSCTSCRRHCRATEPACPFCGARKLVGCAGLIAFVALGVGWTPDSGAGEASSPEATPPARSDVDGGAPDAAVDDDSRHRPIAIYGTSPPPHRPGC